MELNCNCNSFKGHVLLISPLTFSYHIAISDALQSLGYKVTWWNDRPSGTTLYKLLLRLFPKITVRFSETIFEKNISSIDAAKVTHILVIKGEGLSRRFALKMREVFSSASMGLYLWDSVENSKNALNIMAAFDSISTFDPVDAKRFGWHYRPLFWRDITQITKVAKVPKFDWCFIGTIHSDRHKVIHRLRKTLGPKSRSFVLGYFQSLLLLYVRKLYDPTLWYAPKGTLSTSSMTASEIAEIVANSKLVVDIEHPQQRGFTMRTIETLLAQKKLVTTNSSILTSDLYHPSRVHVIKRKSPEIPKIFFETPFIAFEDSLQKYYSCAGWAAELISIQDDAKCSGFRRHS